jgi:membrane dipeptidase
MFASAGTDPGPKNGGLTDTGRAVIERMGNLGMVVDVAHADHNTLEQIVEMNSGPLVDGHTSLCPGTDPAGCGRLRTWDEMELIARTGGIVCTWPLATGTRRTFSDWANELLEMKHRLGIGHVGIGTDGGGHIPGHLPALIDGYNDIRDLIQLIAAMQNIGFSRNEIAAIMGGNFYRVLKRCIG